MGLDMYFTARRYFWSFPEDGDDVSISRDIKNMFPELPKDSKIKEVNVEFGYWRKANAIHNWFVNNVQDGVDECKEYYVSTEDINKLLRVVNEVLADTTKANDLLPTKSGFFFGNTNYDEWYFRDLEYTKTMLENAVNSNMKEWSFYYQASW